MIFNFNYSLDCYFFIDSKYTSIYHNSESLEYKTFAVTIL